MRASCDLLISAARVIDGSGGASRFINVAVDRDRIVDLGDRIASWPFPHALRLLVTELTALLEEVRQCRICEPRLPFGARPVLQCGTSARILIAGQAPGSKVHATGIPFDDPSGERLRSWMGIDRATFYDAASIAILPMGFCYPGTGKSGDLPPRPECAATWRKPLLQQLAQIELTLVIGQYAQTWHFDSKAASLTARVKDWRDYWPTLLPLPHPSPRNNRWFKQNPWFETEILPELKTQVAQLLRKSHE